MSNTYFQFKQFIIHQEKSAMKVTTDACLFGAWAAEKCKSDHAKIVLDAGAGTGLMSLMFAQKNPNSSIDAIEIDGESFDQAKENVSSSPFADRIELFHGDVRTFPFPGKYDLIISNPPFYENELRSEKEKKNVAHHGDQLSLKELLTAVTSNLDEQGYYFLLLPYKRQQQVMAFISEAGLGIVEMILVRQSTRHDYFRIMLQGGLKKNNEAVEINELSIWNEKENYTEEFTRLLKDYYLHL
jgi:tRNA1Val (adenine37-N6)-methyltransferase